MSKLGKQGVYAGCKKVKPKANYSREADSRKPIGLMADQSMLGLRTDIEEDILIRRIDSARRQERLEL